MLKAKYISVIKDAKVLVLFGGNTLRRDAVIKLLQDINCLTIYSTTSELEGMDKICTLERVDFILIGARYTTS